MDLSKLAVGVLAAIAVGGVAYALALSLPGASTRRAQQRQKALVGTGPRSSDTRSAAATTRRATREDRNNLKEIESPPERGQQADARTPHRRRPA